MALFFYKEKNKDIRAAAYLRLSIEDGDKAESNSIGNQRELIRILLQNGQDCIWSKSTLTMATREPTLNVRASSG